MSCQLTKRVKIHPVEVVDGNSYYGNDPGNCCENGVYISQVYPASFGNKASKKASHKLDNAENNHYAVCLDCSCTERRFRIFYLF